jgi:2-hydroxy-3-keto-5-methylthiopentenyl-1-phosphate phosphatase
MTPAIPISNDVAIVLDFDGTMTETDVGDLVADRFGDPRWRELDAAHHEGTLSYRGLISSMFESMRTDACSLAAFAREVGRLRAGTRAFLRAARSLGIPVAIASGGLDVYIRAIVGDDLRGVDLVANEATFDGERVRLRFRDERAGCGSCGNCKAVVVEELRARGARFVIAVGDGVSDRCLARTADLVLARDWLLHHTRSSSRAPIPFEDFHDVARVVAAYVPGFAEALTREA